MLSDEVIHEILYSAVESQRSKVRPAARHFFNCPDTAEKPQHAISIHRWVIADIQGSDSRTVVRYLADTAVKELMKTSLKIAGEIIFRQEELLPEQPLWLDGSPLFSSCSVITGKARFGVNGGNVVESVNCFSDDANNAVRRLSELDQTYQGNERLLLFCAKPMEKKLIRAFAKIKVDCRVFGIYNYKNNRSWVLTRDNSACAMTIGRPSFSIPVKGNKLVVGARFVVWIDDPKLAVCVTPKEDA